METLSYQYFLVLAETLSFTKAANELFKSEPVLSRQITKLENELGLKLFKRSTKSVSLTPAGRILAKGLKDISNSYDALMAEARAVQSGFSGEIKLASLPGQMLHHNFVEILQSFEREFPDIFIDLRTYNLGELRYMLQEQQVDLVFGTRRDFAYNSVFSCEVIGEARNYLVIPQNHPKAKKGTANLTLADFKDDTFIFFKDQSPAIKSIPKIFENSGFILNYIIAPDMNTLMIWLELQRGIACLDETHVYRDSKELVFLPFPELGYNELAVTQNINNTNPCNEVFLQYLRRHRAANL